MPPTMPENEAVAPDVETTISSAGDREVNSALHPPVFFISFLFVAFLVFARVLIYLNLSLTCVEVNHVPYSEFSLLVIASHAKIARISVFIAI